LVTALAEGRIGDSSAGSFWTRPKITWSTVGDDHHFLGREVRKNVLGEMSAASAICSTVVAA